MTTTIDYGYDPLGRLISADYSSGEFPGLARTGFHYTYDSVGNRLTQETMGGANTYAYDAANRLVELDGAALEWDVNGNLLRDQSGAGYSYDHQNRLVSAEMGGSTYSFAYNGLGDRVQQGVDGVSTTYALDMNAGLSQVLFDGTNAYLYGLGRIGEEQPSGWGYHLPDALGSVRQLANETGAAVLAQAYQPFGSPLNAAGLAATSYGFTGEWTDETGLVHLRARYYQPQVGRFFQVDPWGGSVFQPASHNSYLYAAANPIRFRDSSGRCYGDFDFLRGIEPTTCERLDQSLFILKWPDSSMAEKALAAAYVVAWTLEHASIATATLLLAAANPAGAVVGTAFGAVYSDYQYSMAASGRCGCAAQLYAQSVGHEKWVRQGMIQGYVGGSFFGGIGGAGSLGKVAAGTGGLALSGYGIYASGKGMLESGINPCNAMTMAVSVAGGYFSGKTVLEGLGEIYLGGLGDYDLPPEFQPPGRTGQYLDWPDEAIIQAGLYPWIESIRTEFGPRIPPSWGPGRPTAKGIGWRWLNPENPSGFGVRIDMGDPLNTNLSQRVDHVVVRYNWQVIGRNGYPIQGSIADNAINAHIPLYEYRTWRHWFRP